MPDPTGRPAPDARTLAEEAAHKVVEFVEGELSKPLNERGSTMHVVGSAVVRFTTEAVAAALRAPDEAERVIELLIAGGMVSAEKIQQARELARNLSPRIASTPAAAPAEAPMSQAGSSAGQDGSRPAPQGADELREAFAAGFICAEGDAREAQSQADQYAALLRASRSEAPPQGDRDNTEGERGV